MGLGVGWGWCADCHTLTILQGSAQLLALLKASMITPKRNDPFSFWIFPKVLWFSYSSGSYYYMHGTCGPLCISYLSRWNWQFSSLHSGWLLVGSGWPMNMCRTFMAFFPGTGMAFFHHEAFKVLLTPHSLCLDSFLLHLLSMWAPTRLDTVTIAGDFIACETISTTRRVGPWHSHMSPQSSRNPAHGK